MSACPQCGTVAKPTDKFCNTCGTRLAVAAEPAPAPPPYASAQQPQQPAPQPYAAPPQAQPGMQAGPARCQMGHEIAPGASYCAQGHPIALAAMQFSQDQYAAPSPGFGPAGQQPPPFGGQAGFGGYGVGAQGAPPPPMNPQFGAPQPQAYAQPPQAPYAPQGFGAPQQQQPQAIFNPAPQPPQPPVQAYGAPSSTATTPDAGARVLRGFLVAYQANTNGEFWPLMGGRISIGRAGSGETVDIALADPTISSKHAIFHADGATGALLIEDTGSTNGTFVNEEHIGFNGRRELRDGDRVRFGGFTTIVKVIGRI